MELHEEIKKAVEPVMTAFEEFKKTNDAALAEIKAGKPDPVTTDKLTKIESSLASFEGINQKLTLAEQKQKAAEEQMGAMSALIAKMEAKLGRPGIGGQDRKIELKKLVNQWGAGVVQAVCGMPLSDEQRKVINDITAEYKVMRISDDTTGGYLAPPEFVKEIIEAVVLVSNARSIVNVRQTANKAVRIPKRTGVFAARRATEQVTRTETTGLTFGMEEMALPEMYAIVDISNEDLEDSAFDLESYIRDNASEQFAVKEGQEFVSGSGIGEMEGVLTNVALTGTTIGTTNSGVAATLGASGDPLLTAFYALKTAYAQRAQWIMNRTTLGTVRKFKDGVGNYLWMPGIANAAPNTINGASYVEMPDMPSEGVSTYPIAFADWKRAYTIGDRIAMQFLRDPYTQGASGNVRMWFRRRVGGQVVLGEAIQLVRCHT